MGLAEQADLVVKLSLKDELSRGVAGAKAQLKGFEGTVGRIGSHVQRGVGNAVRNIERLAMVGATAFVGGLTAGVRWAADFESQLNTINTVAGVTDEQLATIGEGIRGLARDSGTALEDLTAGYYDLVSAGIAYADAEGVLTAANTLAIGGLATTAETVDLLTTALNSYNLDASRATEVANIFAQAIASGKVTAEDLAGSFANVAPLAASAGIEIEELAAGYATLTAKGVPAAETSTQMRAAIVALQKPTAELDALQTRLGINFEEFARENGLAAAYQLIREEADRSGVPMIQYTGRIEAANYALSVTGENAVVYAHNLQLVNRAQEGVGVAATQAAERQQGLTHQWGRFKATVKDVGITIGTELLPELAKVAKEAADFLGTPEARAKIKQFAKDLAQGFRDLAGFVKGLDWQAIAGTLQNAAGFAQQVMKWFLDAPEWLKTAVITGWGLNKLTGGAFGSIVGELGKGLIKGVLGMNAGVVNINAGVVNGVPGGAAGAGAAPVGGRPGILGGALAIGAGAVGATLLDNLFGNLAGEIKTGREQLTADGRQITAEQRAAAAHLTGPLEFMGGLLTGVPLLGPQSVEIGKEMQTISGLLSDPPPVTLSNEELLVRDNAIAAAIPMMGQQIQDATARAIPMTGQLIDQVSSDLRDYSGRIVSATHQSSEIVRDYSGRIVDAGHQNTERLTARLDRNNDGTVTTKEVLSERLGVSIDVLRGIHGNEEKVAERLGISVDELRLIRGEAMTHAARVNIGNERLSELRNQQATNNNLQATNNEILRNKNFELNIRMPPVTITARQVAGAIQTHRTLRGGAAW